ncbi:hypothetical protein C3Y91_11260 [Rhizobium sp. UPM1133]|nr:hypothetical protein [Rhizobium ruizarguesonis]
MRGNAAIAAGAVHRLDLPPNICIQGRIMSKAPKRLFFQTSAGFSLLWNDRLSERNERLWPSENRPSRSLEMFELDCT